MKKGRGTEGREKEEEGREMDGEEWKGKSGRRMVKRGFLEEKEENRRQGRKE